MVVFLVLDISGEVKEVDKKINNDKFKLDDTMSLVSIKGIVINKGKSKLERLVIWNNDNIDIHVYGFKNGSDNIKNHHSLPAPLDQMSLFGDILLIGSINNEIIDMSEDIYLEFFTNNAFDDVNPDSDMDIPEDAEEVENDDEIMHDLNSVGSENEVIEMVDILDDDDVSYTVEISIEDELQLEPEYLLYPSI